MAPLETTIRPDYADFFSGVDTDIQDAVRDILDGHIGGVGEKSLYGDVDYKTRSSRLEQAKKYLESEFGESAEITPIEDSLVRNPFELTAQEKFGQFSNTPNFAIQFKNQTPLMVFGVDPKREAPLKIRQTVGTFQGSTEEKKQVLLNSLLDYYGLPKDENIDLNLKTTGEAADAYGRDKEQMEDRYGSENFIYLNPETKRWTLYDSQNTLVPYKKEFRTLKNIENLGRDFVSVLGEGVEAVASAPVYAMTPRALSVLGIAAKPLLRNLISATTSAAAAQSFRTAYEEIIKEVHELPQGSELAREQIDDKLTNMLLEVAITWGAPSMIKGLVGNPLVRAIVRKALLDKTTLPDKKSMVETANELGVVLPSIGAIGPKHAVNEVRKFLELMPLGNPLRKRAVEHTNSMEKVMLDIAKARGSGKQSVLNAKQWEEAVETGRGLSTLSNLGVYVRSNVENYLERFRKQSNEKYDAIFENEALKNRGVDGFSSVDQLKKEIRDKAEATFNPQFSTVKVDEAYFDKGQVTPDDIQSLRKIWLDSTQNPALFDAAAESLAKRIQNNSFEAAMPALSQLEKRFRAVIKQEGGEEYYVGALKEIENLKNLLVNNENIPYQNLRNIKTRVARDLGKPLFVPLGNNQYMTNTLDSVDHMADFLKAFTNDISSAANKNIDSSPELDFAQKAALKASIVDTDKWYSSRLEEVIKPLYNKLLAKEDDEAIGRALGAITRSKTKTEGSRLLKNLIEDFTPAQSEAFKVGLIRRMLINPNLLERTDDALSNLKVANYAQKTHKGVENSIKHFVNNYNNLDGDTVELLFGSVNSERGKLMKNFVDLYDGIGDRTELVLGTLTNVGFIGAGMAAIATGDATVLAKTASGMAAVSQLGSLLSNQKFLRWLVGASKKDMTKPSVLRHQLLRLAAIGARDPEITDGVNAYISAFPKTVTEYWEKTFKDLAGIDSDDPEQQLESEGPFEDDPIGLKRRIKYQEQQEQQRRLKPATSAALPTAPAPLTGTVDPTRFSQLFPDSGSIVTSEDLLRRQA